MNQVAGELADDIEVAAISAVMIAEEIAVERVTRVGVNGERVEVVREVRAGEREANGVLGAESLLPRNEKPRTTLTGRTGSLLKTRASA